MEPGQIVTHYEIVRQRGQGGMGVVYEAMDTRLDRLRRTDSRGWWTRDRYPD